MPLCLCCRDRLVRQIYKSKLYGYCCSCRQLMLLLAYNQNLDPIQAATRETEPISKGNTVRNRTENPTQNPSVACF